MLAQHHSSDDSNLEVLKFFLGGGGGGGSEEQINKNKLVNVNKFSVKYLHNLGFKFLDVSRGS